MEYAKVAVDTWTAAQLAWVQHHAPHVLTTISYKTTTAISAVQEYKTVRHVQQDQFALPATIGHTCKIIDAFFADMVLKTAIYALQNQLASHVWMATISSRMFATDAIRCFKTVLLAKIDTPVNNVSRDINLTRRGFVRRCKRMMVAVMQVW